MTALVFSLVLAAVLLPGLPIHAWAEGTVTGVSTEAELRAALENANANVKLTANIEMAKRLVITNKDVVLDLNGHTLSGGSNDYIILVSGGSLTIRDTSTATTGKIQPTLGEAIHISDNGTVTIESGKIYSDTELPAIYCYQGTLIMNGGTIESKNVGIQMANSHLLPSNILTITGGTITSQNGCAVQSGNNPNSTINISGGTFTGKTGSAAIQLYSTDNAFLSGGTFNGGIEFTIWSTSNKTVEDFLADGKGYWKGTAMLNPAYEAAQEYVTFVLNGDITIQNACPHTGNSSYAYYSGGQHFVLCSNCNYKKMLQDCVWDTNTNDDTDTIVRKCTGCYNETTATLKAYERTYDGTEQTGLYIEYDESWFGPKPTLENETGTAAGTYTGKMVLKSSNPEYSYSVEKDFTINKAPLTVKAEDKETDYQQEAPSFTVTYDGFVTGEDASVLTGTLAFACDYDIGDDAGSYDITPKGLIADNYDIKFEKGTLTVNKISGSGSVALEDWTYGETPSPHVPTSDTNDPENVAYTYAVKGEDSYSDTIPTDAGDYTVKATFAETTNYQAAEAYDDFTIHPREVTVMAELVQTSFPYNGQDQKPVPTVTANGLLNADALQYDLVYRNNRDAGDATVTLKAKGNYTFPELPLTFTITRLTPTAENFSGSMPKGSGEGDSPVYNGSEQEAAFTVSYPDTNHIGMGDFTLRYYRDGKETRPIDAGTYTVKLDVAQGQNYEAALVESPSWTFTILPKPITPTVTVENGLYDTQPQTPALTVMDGETLLDADQYEASYTNNIHAGEEALVTVTMKNNYSGTGQKAFSIYPAMLTVAADDVSAVVGRAMPQLTYSVSGLLGDDVLTTLPTLSCPVDNTQTPGSYPIAISGASASSDYIILYRGGTFTVKQEHAVIPGTASGGTVTLDTEKAAEGTPVTITVEPRFGMKLVSLTVTDDRGNPVTLHRDENGNYVFFMPDSPVTVKAEFKSILSAIADPTNPKTGDSFAFTMNTLLLSAAALYLLTKKRAVQ